MSIDLYMTPTVQALADIVLPACTYAERRAQGGELPTCVKHCQAHVLKFGEVEDLARDLAAKPKQVLYAM